MDIPESLRRKIDLFSASGLIFREQDELFTEVAWQQVFIGQGIVPTDTHPLVNALKEEQLQDLLSNLKAVMQLTSQRLGSHADFLQSCHPKDM